MTKGLLDSVSRRALWGLGALGIGVTGALADQNFTAFGFKSSLGTANRTDPARWNDWINVKEFGATANGVTDDTAAIQAAFDAIPTTPTAAGGPFGTVYFPAGTYKVSSPITYQTQAGKRGIVIRGDGIGSWIVGSVNGYIFKGNVNPQTSNDGPFTIRDLAVVNSNTGANTGAILANNIQVGTIQDCYIEGMIGINLWGASVTGFAIYPNASISVINCAIAPTTTYTLGTIGIQMGNGHQVIGCDLVAFDHAIRATNLGCVIMGGRMEDNNCAIVMGMDDAGTLSSCAAFYVAGISQEANNCGIWFVQGGGGLIAGVGTSGSTDGALFTGTTACAGTSGQSTITNIKSSTYGLAVGQAVSGVNIAAGATIGSIDSATQITLVAGHAHTGTVTSATFGGSAGTSKNSVVGYDLSSMVSGVVIGGPGGVFSQAAILGGSNGNANQVFIGGVPNASGGGVAWSGVAGASFIGCNQAASVNTVAFSGLPSSPAVGQEMFISDSNTATWGATIAAGGANHVIGKWNGAAWKVVSLY